MQERVFAPLGMADTVPDASTMEADDDFPLFNLFREKVVDPRTIKGDTPKSVNRVEPNRATPYFPRYGADPHYGFHLMRPLDYSCYAGASVFVSTPSDLVRFGMGINAGKLLQADTVRMLQTPQRLNSGAETPYGLGWEIESVTLAGAPARAVGHKGRVLGGPAASLVTFPERGIAVALVSNTAYADTYGPAVKIAEGFVTR
jgi:CubicO group peptidase (beta-lactamase class C family)